MGWKFNPFTDKLDRTELPGDGDTNQRLTKNDTAACGNSWQDKGVSYLTDELGNALTDELGNALEGVDTIDGSLLTSGYYSPQDLTESEDIHAGTTDAFCIGTITVNLIDPAIATHKVTIANESSTAETVTITTDAGTVYPTTTLTKDQSVTLAPRPTRWIQV